MNIIHKKLEKSFVRNNYSYKQIYCNDKYYIYSVAKDDNILYYELFRSKKHDGFIINGKKVEPSEIYPCNNDFGKWAWCCISKERALEKIKELESPSIPETKLPKNNNPKHKGRPIVWKNCKKCSKNIKTSEFNFNKGFCNQCGSSTLSY